MLTFMISGHEENQAPVATRAMASDMRSGPPLCTHTTCCIQQWWQCSFRNQGKSRCGLTCQILQNLRKKIAK